MKQIDLKTVAMEGGALFDYRQMILTIAKSHPNGITIAEMEKAVRVIGQVRQADGVLKLEDADWETLKKYLESFPWAVADPVIIQFHRDIVEAENIPLK